MSTMAQVKTHLVNHSVFRNKHRILWVNASLHGTRDGRLHLNDSNEVYNLRQEVCVCVRGGGGGVKNFQSHWIYVRTPSYTLYDTSPASNCNCYRVNSCGNHCVYLKLASNMFIWLAFYHWYIYTYFNSSNSYNYMRRNIHLITFNNSFCHV